MIWATASSWSCFCRLYRASPALAAKNIINDFSINHLMMPMCRVVSCIVGVVTSVVVCYDHSVLGKTLLAFALLHFVLQGQTCLLLQVSLDFLLLHSSPPLWGKEHVFLKFSCFFYDPMDVGNLISGSSAFSKSSLNIWKFIIHRLLKPRLENFVH